MSYLAKNYNRKKISFKYGKGSYLYSTNKKKYLDFVQGIAVNSLGHANPKLIKTIKNKSKKTIELIEYHEKLKNLEIQNKENKFLEKKESKKINKKTYKKKRYYKKTK